MKVTIYTISDCQFSKQEKEYLAQHNIPFEEKNLETNREFLTEMLTVSNNFAGTPVTKIEKDYGQSIILKGFTKEEFDKEFSFDQQSGPVPIPPSPPPLATVPATSPQPAFPQSPTNQTSPPPSPFPVSPPSANETQSYAPPSIPTFPTDQTTQQPTITDNQSSSSFQNNYNPTMANQPPSPSVSSYDSALNSILTNLETKSQSNMESSPPSNVPNIPEPDFSPH